MIGDVILVVLVGAAAASTLWVLRDAPARGLPRIRPKPKRGQLPT